MKLNERQQQAATTDSPITVCIAGPGSGKSTTLVEAVAHAAERGTPPEKIVLVTFTNAAANELRRRLDARIAGFGQRLCYSGTLHGLMLRLVQRCAGVVGFATGKISVVDEEQAKILFEQSLVEQGWKGTKKDVLAAIERSNFWACEGARTRRMDKADLVAASYHRKMLTGNLIDFDGLLQAGLKILRDGYSLPGDPSHLYVDEAQDSATLDWQIYDAAHAEKKFFVGDPDQSIYGFRGADVARFLEHAQARGVPGRLTVALEANYRSGTEICDAAQRLINRNQSRYNKRTVSATGTLGDVKVRHHAAPAEQAAEIVRDIQIFGLDAAVLTRTNHCAQFMATALQAAGIPVKKRKLAELPQDWRAARTFLTLLTNPNSDTLAALHLEHRHGTETAKTALRAANQALKTVNEHSLHLPLTTTPAQAAEQAARNGYSAESVALIQAAAGKLAPGATLSELVLSIGSALEHNEEEGHGVTVSTIHAAKGREWHTVYVTDFEDEIIPSKRKDTDIEESRRIAYVAITRAKERLEIHWCKKRTPEWGQPYDATPSRFLAEMGFTTA